MAIIDFQGVERVFHQNGKAFVALKDLNLQVQDREFVAIVGPSGCGKTTCMRMAAGLEHPTAGTVSVDNEVVTAPGPDRAVVFQAFALFLFLHTQSNYNIDQFERNDRDYTRPNDGSNDALGLQPNLGTHRILRCCSVCNIIPNSGAAQCGICKHTGQYCTNDAANAVDPKHIKAIVCTKHAL